jgi:hypothetical protein
LRKATAAIAVMAGLLLVPAAAQAISLKGYLRIQTFKHAKSLAVHTRDAEKYGVGHCIQSSDGQHAKCIGVVAGHSINPADTTQTPLGWTYKFIDRAFFNPRSGRVRIRTGAKRCFGNGCPYITRHK